MTPIVPTFEIAKAVPIGRLVLTLPAGRSLPKKGRRALDQMIAAEADGFAALAGACLVEFERALGVTIDDRLVAGSLRNPRGVPVEDLERLSAADEALRNDKTPPNVRKQAKRAILEIRQRQRGRIRRADEAEVRRGIAETLSLAAERGEEFTVHARGDAPVARRKAGLDWLHAKERISDVQMAAGTRYGDDYRMAEDIALRVGAGGESVQGGGQRRDHLVDRRLNAQDRLKDARGALTHPKMVDLCDLVAGEGKRVRDISNSYTEQSYRNEAVLIIALDLLALHYGMIRK